MDLLGGGMTRKKNTVTANGGEIAPHHIDSSILHDELTGLPSYLAKLDELEEILCKNHCMGMLYVDLSYLELIEEKFGTHAYEEIVTSIGEIIHSLKGTAIRNDDIIAVGEVGTASPMIFLSSHRVEKADSFLSKENVETISERVQDYIFSKLFYLVYPYMKERPKISVGYSFVVDNPLIAKRRLIYSLIEEAKNIAKLQQSRLAIRNKERLQEIIVNENIQTVFQPIVDLRDMSILGYEALSRGPVNTEFETPIMLFALARETGLLFELDRLCRKKALQNAKTISSDKLVFVNTLPNTIHDPEFRGKYLKDFLKDINIRPSNIVFEITEGAAIENYGLFREAVKYYTDLGISVAIDDTGTGYSTLESIIEIRPQYLKFDISMIKNIDKSIIKRELLKALISVSNHIKAKVIAEGIETYEELNALIKLGVHIGQGFIFSRPGPAFPEINRLKVP